MNKVEEKLIQAQAMALSATANKSGDLRKRQRWGKLGFIIISAMAMLAMMCCSAFAAGDIESKIAAGMQDVYKVIQGVAIPIAVIAVAFSAFQFFAGGEKGMEKAKKCLIYTAIGLGVIFLAPVIIKQVAGWFAGNGSTSGVWDGSVPTGGSNP